MLRTSTTLCTFTGAALLAAGIAFADAGIAPLAQSQEFSKQLSSMIRPLQRAIG
jgi:hypothetical protein